MSDDADEYRLQPPREPAPALAGAPPPVGVFEKLAEVRREEAPPPPASTFFSQVFEFPWTAGVWPRWVFLSLGCTTMFLLTVFIVWLAGSMSGPGGAAVAFFVLPQIWIAIWTLSYAASCGLQIIEDTAAGNPEVLEWPDPNWREWAARLGYVGFLLAISLSVSFGVSQLLQSATGAPAAITTFVGAILLFPLILLSSLNENSVWMVFSPALAWELARKPQATLVCYGLLAAAWAVVGGLAWIGWNWTVFAVFLAGPATSAAILISARLIGRLAWQTQTGGRKKTRTRPADSAESLPPRSW